MTLRRIIIWGFVLFVLSGCGRHVVVKPDNAAGLNDADWTVKNEPATAAETTKSVK